ncbi:hypothetical protein HOLleu_13659 [Holothuria leucospilota]|uniref:Uncharacterized protein n=1 Tax=Holothuria leucospilota TaxID=206669 RepID=A0A9Q1C717_HOLLE|nr:hypothetical protein HOLleu_13659 [Holothuria leucospilota]
MPETGEDQWHLNPSRFSNWGTLVRVLAYVIRFANNCRAMQMNRETGKLSVGAETEMELTKLLDQNRIQEESVNKGLQWIFNPPLTPHFGGVHESLVKSLSAKRAMYAILGKADISDEELHSAIVGAEGLLNSRPLTYQSASAKDTILLTPNHFLHGQMDGRFAADVQIDTTQFNPRKRWRRVQESVSHFWTRLLREWIPTLNQHNQKAKRLSDSLPYGYIVTT